MLGGILMFAVGAAFLVSERNLMARTKSARKNVAAAGGDGFSRGILGVQVCIEDSRMQENCRAKTLISICAGRTRSPSNARDPLQCSSTASPKGSPPGYSDRWMGRPRYVFRTPTS